MEKIDVFHSDSTADDHASRVGLHKLLSRAKGNDRNKQGVIMNASNQL